LPKAVHHQELFMELLNYVIYGNTVRQWGLALLATVVLALVLRLGLRLVQRRIKRLADRTKTGLDDLVVDLFRRTKWWFLVLESAYISTIFLNLPKTTDLTLSTIAILVLIFQSGFWGVGLLDYVIRTRLRQEEAEQDAAGTTTVSALGYVARVALWVVVLLLILQNAGVEVTALIASLGVGGVAVALALQNILGDLFASLAMVLDKPFVLGDFIIVGDFMGTVEKIGLKTTRIRSLSGEQIVFSNSDLLNSRVRNYKRMFERRVVFSFGVVYDTPADTLSEIGGWVEKIIEDIDQTRFDRAHFSTFGDSSLNFEVVYYVLNSDYNVYMDIQQAINLALLSRFEAEGVEFAFPTQTIYLSRAEGSAA
jgi:small-conductance mechanosensitive channel